MVHASQPGRFGSFNKVQVGHSQPSFGLTRCDFPVGLVSALESASGLVSDFTSGFASGFTSGLSSASSYSHSHSDSSSPSVIS